MTILLFKNKSKIRHLTRKNCETTEDHTRQAIERGFEWNWLISAPFSTNNWTSFKCPRYVWCENNFYTFATNLFKNQNKRTAYFTSYAKRRDIQVISLMNVGILLQQELDHFIMTILCVMLDWIFEYKHNKHTHSRRKTTSNSYIGSNPKRSSLCEIHSIDVSAFGKQQFDNLQMTILIH